jgi:hypothetical protein
MTLECVWQLPEMPPLFGKFELCEANAKMTPHSLLRREELDTLHIIEQDQSARSVVSWEHPGPDLERAATQGETRWADW